MNDEFFFHDSVIVVQQKFEFDQVIDSENGRMCDMWL